MTTGQEIPSSEGIIYNFIISLASFSITYHIYRRNPKTHRGGLSYSSRYGEDINKILPQIEDIPLIIDEENDRSIYHRIL